ncbi:MAG: glycosyltransferase family A protein [Cellulosilyticaceae bacterium]
MKPNTKFIVLVNFNNAKWNDLRLTKEWIEHRMHIFMNYTYKSLRNQTNQDFETVVLYDVLSEQNILEALSQYEKVPETVHILPVSEGLAFINEAIQSYDYLCYNKIDSDNLYHKDFIQYLHDYMPNDETTILVSPNGYVYNALTGEMARYSSTYASLYTHLYTVSDYLNKIRHPVPVGGLENCPQIICEIIEYPNFIINVHDSNVLNSTRLLHPSRLIHDQALITTLWEEFTGDSTLYLLKQ